MEELICECIRRHWTDVDSVEVEDFAVIAGGYSRETYRFEAHVHRGGTRHRLPMILRKNPPPAAAILHTSRHAEHELLEAVRKNTSIPVSRSYMVETGLFGEEAMLIERMQGCGEPSLLFNGGPNADQAEAVATHLCELIAELHTTDPGKLNPNGTFDDPRGLGLDVSSWDSYMDGMLNYYVNSYEKFAFDAMPVFRDAFLHIRRNKPRPLPLVLTHGDFNPANFLYDSGRVTALIDWENAHIGDPREDLGWMAQMDTLSNTNIMGSVKEDGGFLGHYNRLTGFNVTEEELGYFRLFSAGNIGVPVLEALQRRMVKEHTEILHMYIMQPAVVSGFAIGHLMGYPMGAPAAATEEA
jgi:aminoglycoside phosphotransferase (APT) family kinase protein